MAVYKQPGSDFWLIEFTFEGHRYRRSSKTTNKREAEANEAKWRTDLRAQQYLGVPPPEANKSWGCAA